MADAAGDYRAAQEMAARQGQDERARRLNELKKEFPNPIPKSTSDFHHHGLNALKAMIENSDPGAVKTAGHNWRSAADSLGGTDGNGGIRKAFKDAVEHAMAHWEGPASQKFREAAQEVLIKIDRSYGHARNAQRVMIGEYDDDPASTAWNLQQAKEHMKTIHEPSEWEKIKDKVHDGSRDDSQFHKDMANPNMDARTALALNRDSLSKSKERQVEAVIVMEELGFNYQGQARALKPTVIDGDKGDWPSAPNNVSPPPPVIMPVVSGVSSPKTATSGGISGRGKTGTISSSKPVTSPRESALPRDSGISGGVQKPVASTKPQIGTGIDGISGGVGSGTGGTTGVGGGVGAGGSVGGSVGTSGGVSGGAPGALGALGRRGTASGGSATGRAGASGRGMPGSAGGAGSAAGARGGSARSGGLARQRGGVVGAAKGGTGTGKGTQGGSGLHKSRGAAGAGKSGKAGRGATGRGSSEWSEEEEQREHDRPDYLVEDEETWTPERNVAPRVIE